MTSKSPNLEEDFLASLWILSKVKHSSIYAQNLYAALCNNTFQKLETISILTETTWSCSWRCAGGIVADLRGEGDYLDWYCSGIIDTIDEIHNDENSISDKYVPEGKVTLEIQNDLLKLGWKIINEQNDPS